ncbi:Hypothetical predicted protein [Mytilus galloprovincialis]|uniref:WSC domain-containing protein n=1 Tax=Mytilus galloprovincialis TaxID=29158 RepID=A0A8B6EA05_MYTGA|nr:Hypothetical predicted protein [Mytilus galloprovincialis]
MINSVISMVLISSVIYLKSADAVMVASCYKLDSSWTDVLWGNFNENDSLCKNICKEASLTYTYYGTTVEQCFCGKTIPTLSNNNGNNCAGQNSFRWLLTVSEIGESFTTSFMDLINTDTSQSTTMKSTNTKKSITATSANAHTSISTESTLSTTDIEMSTSKENGEWSRWNDWTFCEVNCVREDTTNGTQSRLRTCNGSKCSGKNVEERACSEPEICKGMRPRKLLCKCPKRLINTKWHFLDGMNITDAEVKKIVLEDFNKNTKSEISVNKKTVSKEVRKKISSVNQKKSSQSIGLGCIVFLVLPMVFLIAIDILNCCIHFRSRFGGRKRNLNRPISNTQVQRERPKPLQENSNNTENYYASRCGNNFHPDEMKRETCHRRRDDTNQPSRDEWLQYI